MSRHAHDKRKPADITPTAIFSPSPAPASPAPASTVQRQPAAFEAAAPEATLQELSAAPLSAHSFGSISLFPPETASAPPPDSGGGPTVQASLRVSAPNDPYEQEADTMADMVMRAPSNGPDMPSYYVQRTADGAGLNVSPQVESSIGQMQGGGQPLPASERGFFENRFGHDFSNVRIHADDHAAETAQSLNARAFTVGNDIAFDSGEYQPGSEGGRHLLAHELTHTIQQTGGVATKRVQRMLNISEKNGKLVATSDSHRPSGPLADSGQGDHMTPFTTFQHQLINAIRNQELADAWGSLVDTHQHYTTLPGYALSAKWLIDQSDTILATNQSVDASTVTAADIQDYANTLLGIRNRLKYTSVPTKGGTTGGNNESNTAGALQELEKKLQRGGTTPYNQGNVLVTIWAAFDGTRYQTLTNASEKTDIIEQHVSTMLDAYPTITEHFGLTDAIVKAACPY